MLLIKSGRKKRSEMRDVSSRKGKKRKDVLKSSKGVSDQNCNNGKNASSCRLQIVLSFL